MSVHPELEALAGGSLASVEREAALDHIAACSSCRARLAASDPACLFSLLALVRPPAGALERLSLAVAASTAESPRHGRERRVGIGAVAAAVAAAALLGGLLWRSPEADRGRPLASGEPLANAAAVPATMIEVQSPVSAQWLDLSVGDTQLIMIFDERLDL